MITITNSVSLPSNPKDIKRWGGGGGGGRRNLIVRYGSCVSCVCVGGGGRGGTRRNISNSVVALRACLSQTDIVKPWRRTWTTRCPPECETFKLLSVQSVCSLSVQSVCCFVCKVCFLFVQSVSSFVCTVCFSLCSLFPLFCTVCFLLVQLFPLCTVVFLFVCTVCFALSVQSISLCLCSLFPSLPQWRCGTNNDHIYTLSAALHATLFSKFLSFLTLSLRNKRCGRLLRQSVRSKSKFGKRP